MTRHRRVGAGKRPALHADASRHGRAEAASVEHARMIAWVLWIAWPLAAFLILAASADRAEFDPTSSQYGMNWPGDLQRTLAQAAVETAVLVLILRPWSFRDSVGRMVLALVLLVPWTAFNFLIAMHTGPIVGARLFWLLLACGALVRGLVVVVAARKKTTAVQPAARG